MKYAYRPTNYFNRFAMLAIVGALCLAGNAALAQLTKLPDGAVPPKHHLYPKGSFKRLQQAPANFSVPLYTSNVSATNFSEVRSVEGVYTAMAAIQTSDSVGSCYQWYQSGIQSAGWQLNTPAMQNIPNNAQVLSLRATRQNEKLSISCIHLPTLKDTTIHISITVK